MTNQSQQKYLARLRDERAERHRLRADYEDLFEQVNHVVHRHDPIGIAFVAPDEYKPEVCTILARLKEAENIDDLRRIVYQEFVFWFNGSSRPDDHYQELAVELWELWQEYPEPRP